MKNYYRKDPKTYEEAEAEYRAGLPREMRKAGTLPKTLKQIRKQVRKVAAEDERKIRAGAKILGSAGALTGRRAKRTVRGDITKKMKKGGFLSTGDDRRDLNIIRTAKNLDDGPASSTSSTTSSSSSNGMKAGGMVKMMKKGGKSTVNKAGNYTKPTMRKALFNRIKAGGKGGRPGQWSARKAQMLAKQYKAKGGGYRG